MIKKILSLLCTSAFVFIILPINVTAQNGASAPQIGDQTTVDIVWSRTTEPTGAIELPVAKWYWSDVENINYSKTDDVWDGGTIGNYYIKDARRPWDTATWHTSRTYWNGTADVRRFHGEFTIPDGYSVDDHIMINTVGDYSSMGLDNIIPINDNIYVFIYPKGQELNDTNFLEYFAFWTGTASQDAAKAVNNGEPITFHGVLGTTPFDYKDLVGNPIPETNLLSHTDGWYCLATQDNVGYIIENSDSRDFVIDLIIEDFAQDGGMDRMDLVFTKTTSTVPPPSPEPEIVNPPTPEPEIEDPLAPLPEPEIPEPEIEDPLAPLPEIPETPEIPEIEQPPKTGDRSMTPFLVILVASFIGILCLFVIMRTSKKVNSRR